MQIPKDTGGFLYECTASKHEGQEVCDFVGWGEDADEAVEDFCAKINNSWALALH